MADEPARDALTPPPGSEPTVSPTHFRRALILTGPTASGKSALALELAPRLNAEIVAMDSMTLYRGMDIGTAKPTPADREAVPHHLLDVLDPWESGNVAWWLRLAADATTRIESRGKTVLFVGGTPFYLKALLRGIFDSPPADPELRARLEAEADLLGPMGFHAKLREVDPASAVRLHPNDIRRQVRAIEVYELTGRPISAWQQQGWFDPAEPTDGEGAETFPRVLAVNPDRDELYRRIERRVQTMLDAGWLDEVERLRSLPEGLSREASAALGYRELGRYLDGETSLSEAVETIRLRSRQFAKRQLTWFRNLEDCQMCEGKLTFPLWKSRMS